MLLFYKGKKKKIEQSSKRRMQMTKEGVFTIHKFSFISP